MFSVFILLNSPILVAAAKSQEELTGEMEGSLDDQIYVGQKCQDMKEGKEEAGQRDLLKEISFTESELKTSFTESALKERKEGCRNPFSNVPFPSTTNKELSKVVPTRKCEHKRFLISIQSCQETKRKGLWMKLAGFTWLGIMALN